MAPVLSAVVQWGVSSGRLGHGKKVGVVVSDQAADQDALERLPAARPQEGRHHAAGPDGGRQPGPDGDDQLRRAAGRREVQGRRRAVRHPACCPENAFFPYIGAENSQQYYPQLLLSDYQSTVEVALGLIPVPYDRR